MTRSKHANWKRGKTKPFFQLDHRLLQLPAYIGLPHTAKTLLCDLFLQYNGFNNGDICITLSVLEPQGWSSNDTLRRALKNLLDSQLLIKTRQGGKNRASLYAFAWLGIDECNGKLEVKPTKAAPIPLSKHPSLMES